MYSSILGKEIAEGLLKINKKVIIFDLAEDIATQTIQEWKNNFYGRSATFIKCDISDHEEFQKAFDTVRKKQRQ